MAREMVVISRHWHQPNVVVGIDKEKIRLELSLEDFCRAVVSEIPHPAATFTRKGLEANILAALQVVLAKAKESSVYNPPEVPAEAGSE